MPSIKYDLRQKIIAQALQEIRFSREYKQGKVRNWKVNEDLYYSRKIPSNDSRANVDLGQMSAFVHSILAKVDNPLTFKFTKRKESQLQRVERLNSLRMNDSDLNNWDIKDLVGKKQALIYGRAIYAYYADSQSGYRSHLENVDVYDFLIDPSGGGIDIEDSMYMGRYGVIKSREELEDGAKGKNPIYLKTETTELLAGSGNSTDVAQEDTNQNNRTIAQNVWTREKEIGNPDKFKFWEWYTTYAGTRYYLLITDTGGTAVRVEKLSDIFESDTFPFWTWAAFADLTEFWTPSYCDYVREIFMAQAVSINQLLDNAEAINKPQKLVVVGAIENMAELKYRKDGQIKVKTGNDINKVFQTVITPPIQTPIEVFNLLDSIQEKASGVTAAAQGDAPNDQGQTATIYQGNEANAADRFGLLNKTYSFGYRRFAMLYEHGVREHLNRKTAIDILGPNGVEIIEVSKRDIFRKNDRFGIQVQASDAETALSDKDKSNKINFLNAAGANPNMVGTFNFKKSFEMQASIAGFTEEEIRELLDTSEFGDAELMAEAERDIEMIIDGETIQPNQAANTAYKQRFVDYMQLNQEQLKPQEFLALAKYVAQLQPIIMRNMVRQANDVLMKQKAAQIAQSMNMTPQQKQPQAQPLPQAQLQPLPQPVPAGGANMPQPVQTQQPIINQQQ